MASGLLARRDGDDTDGTVYTAPADTLSVVNLNIVNTTTTADDVTVYVAPSGATLGTEHKIEVLSLSGKNVLERTNIVLDAGSFISVNATAGTVTNVWGIEESTA
jgi:hypothetical protein